MYSNELLDEIWAIKDEIAREADGDMAKFCENSRKFSELMPRTPEEVRRFIDFGELPTECVHEDETKYEPGTP